MDFTLLLFIVASFTVIIYYSFQKERLKIIPLTLLFFVGSSIAYVLPLDGSNEILLQKLIENLLPAALYLLSADFDIKGLFANRIGCACVMETKRYWSLLLVGGLISLLSQMAAISLGFDRILITSSVIAVSLGTATPRRLLNGGTQVATTMLYLIAVLSGMKIFLK